MLYGNRTTMDQQQTEGNINAGVNQFTFTPRTC